MQNIQSTAAAPQIAEKEVLKLKAQAESLQKLCETREERIQENKRKIEEVRLLSKEEATNFKEANDIIQMLTSKLCEMSEKNSGRQEAEDKGGVRRCPETGEVSVVAVGGRRKKVLQVEDNMSSPIVLSSKLRFGGAHSGIGRMDPVKVARVEEYEVGVSITFTTLPHGNTRVRRIRFSRKHFNEREAKRWWEQNNNTVCGNYGIHGYAIPNT